MIYIPPCDYCKNKLPLIDGWKMACRAFPDGIPYDFDMLYSDEKEECNNGFKYEPEEDAE